MGTFLRRILHQNAHHTFDVTDLSLIVFHQTKSQVLLANNREAYCCKFTGLAGLFRKDNAESFNYGRQLCDEVKIHFQCNGFFTSDELPRYGISRLDIRYLYQQYQPSLTDLIVILAYPYNQSKNIQNFLINHFTCEYNFG